MARPTKEGLDYFSLDTDILGDDKVKLIKAKHGLAGFAIVILLLTKIYHNGYYYQWSEDEQYLFADDTRTDINTLSSIVNDCLNKGFFNQKLYEQYGILTSRGIQKRFIQACTRRKKVTMIREYCIIDDYIQEQNINNVVLAVINVDNNSINVDSMQAKTPQSKVKESKEKVKESKDDDNAREAEPVDKSKTPDFTLLKELERKHGPMSPVEMSCLTEWRESFAENILTECFRRYKANGGMGRKYMDSIFVNWLKAEVKTLDDIQCQDEIFEKQKNKQYTPRGKPDDVTSLMEKALGGI